MIAEIEAKLSGFISEAEHYTDMVHQQEAEFAQSMTCECP